MSGVLRKILFTIFTAMLSIAGVVSAQITVPSGDIAPDVWAVDTSLWENGNPGGYSESQTAAMVVKITTNSSSQITFDVCLQVRELNSGKYGFTSFSPWNTDVSPSNFPPNGSGPAIAGLNVNGDFAAYNATINSVSVPALGQGSCAANYLGVTAIITKTTAADPAYFLYGGVLAQAGATLPAGSPDATVPAGKSASTINGVFQSRIASGGDKTINFKGDLISLLPGITLIKTVTDPGSSCTNNQQKTITVAQGANVKFCFEVQNTGQTPLIDVTLYDNTLAVDLTSSLTGLTDEDSDTNADDLALGSSAFAEYVVAANDDIANVATATGSGEQSMDNSTANVYFCGDGQVNPGEQCDDGNNVDSDGCTANCQCGVCGCGIPETDSDADGTPDCLDSCPTDPTKTNPGICGCGISDIDTDQDGIADCNDSCPKDPTKIVPGICGCGESDVDSDADGTVDCEDECPTDPAKTTPGTCGCGVSDDDSDNDGTPDCNDLCPADPDKMSPGLCGCGTPDTDSDADGTPDCQDLCINDPAKTSPGICGCGVADTDTDNDQVADCLDLCPTDPSKVDIGLCGCGVADTDSDSDGTPNCNDDCPQDPNKTDPGVCGCGQLDLDMDQDGTFDCNDQCKNDPNKTLPGICGCGIADTDTDSDGTPDCNDRCIDDPSKTMPGLCGCGVADTDSDNDGTPDCQDKCVDDPNKLDPGICGCGIPDVDSDNDGTMDCEDLCPQDPNKTNPTICGCGVADTDSDGDQVADCIDDCPDDNLKTDPGICGCGTPDDDTDKDGTVDCNDLCVDDPFKVDPGLCGCGIADTDTDNDGTADCDDKCIDDPLKIAPGFCDCETPDTDTDGDGTYDCDDLCIDDPLKTEEGLCGCGIADTDSDQDGTPDCEDLCPDDAGKLDPGICGCGATEDANNDGIADCQEFDCSDTDITQTLFSLDGGANDQLGLLDRSIKLLRRKGGSKRFIKNTLRRGGELRDANWVLTWSIPQVQTNCSASPLCVDADQRPLVATYNVNAQELRTLTESVLGKLKRKRGLRKLVKKYSKRADNFLTAALALSAQVPETTTVCSTPASTT